MKENNMRWVTVLGATGSIGKSTLSVLAKHRNQFSVYALSAHRQSAKLAEQCLAFQPRYAVLADAEQAKILADTLQKANCPTQVLSGNQALCDIAAADEVDLVVAAIVGAAGLSPTWVAAQAGKTILLANKETLVMAGALFMQLAQDCHAHILPVDSEHNAIYQVLPHSFSGSLKDNGIESLILTASGGPFRNLPIDQFAHITPKMALKHPNWQMGQKISIDSASMMNKGLEVIEAHWLFRAPLEHIEVVVHPQSIIHSMVRYCDGSILAQLGTPDMRTPIAYCLGLPERIDAGVQALDFTQLSGLTFQAADTQRFPCLSLAFQALRTAGDAPCVLNAANEVAVEAFLQEKIRFIDIAAVIEETLSKTNLSASGKIDDLLDKDRSARRVAEAILTHFQAA